MPYCDNAHALSLDAETAEDGKTRLSNVLQNWGFDLREEMSATSYFLHLGGLLMGRVALSELHLRGIGI